MNAKNEQAVQHDPTLVAIALKDLSSAHCFCGRRKRDQQSFCRDCTSLLPLELRAELGNSIKSGYAEAYEAAKTYLCDQPIERLRGLRAGAA
ncbi:MAG TPA: hypothetical protein VN622_09025 [Clostridia bacterium]|nr:hypothetical protein [Clostridia bacterium]